MKCYKYDLIKFKKGILDNLVDAVYVLLLEGSDRTKSVYQQINNLKLCKKNYIQINKGYKKCKKKLRKQNSTYDLLHANYTCFKHANKKNFNRILVLEDDFEFSNYINKFFIIKEIDLFLQNNECNVYSFGNLIGHRNNINKHSKMEMVGGAHSMIISKYVRNTFIKDYPNNDIQMDYYYNKFDNKYTYYYPLCYQKFPATENSRIWSNWFFKISIKLLLLDKYPYIGFNILNFISLFLFTRFYHLYLAYKSNLFHIILNYIIAKLTKFNINYFLENIYKRKKYIYF